MTLGVALAVAGLALRLGGPQAGPGRRATVHSSAQAAVAGHGRRLGGAATAIEEAGHPLPLPARLALDLRPAPE